jgi:hypothetical protein
VLQKFLFVGVGGSGGKTLRILRDELLKRLEAEGYNGGIPKAWQFLHIDVPARPDGNEAGLPEQLPAGCYVPLAAAGVSYRDIDATLLSKGHAVLEQMGGWRPDPRDVQVAPVFGAGQYRAVGRVVAAASMQNLVSALRAATTTLNLVDVEAELAEVSSKLGQRSGDPPGPPMAVVVSSLAGGSGAGCFLDVCDALRLIGGGYENSLAILYTPDVFQGLDSRNGVQANTLATLSELLAGYWNNLVPVPGEFAFLESAGLAQVRIERRGPRYPFIVGASNSRVTFSSQSDVYRAVGRSLASWTTSTEVQDKMRTSVLGNWSENGRRIDRIDLSLGAEQPLSSLGYASVGLGRDRFARYATERLAGEAVDRILHGYEQQGADADEGLEALIERAAKDQLWHFQAVCGLRELGQEHNDILDALRGGDEMQARVPRLREAKKRIVRDVQAGRSSLERRRAADIVAGRLNEQQLVFLEEERKGDQEHAREWVLAVQDRVVAATADLLGQVGADVTARVLELTISDLRASVVPELRRDAETHRRFLENLPQRIHGIFTELQADVIQPDHPLIERGVKEGTDSYRHEAEANLHELAADLIADLADNLLRPLREAVDRGRAKLAADAMSSPERPSPVDRWLQVRDFVPVDLEPSQNEALLEQPHDYPAAYEEQVRRTAGTKDPASGEAKAVREIIGGADADGRQHTIVVDGAWSPRPQVLRTSGGAQTASFKVLLDAETLKRRAGEWVVREDRAIGTYVRESLADYLSAKQVDPRIHEDRLDTFRGAFAQALTTSMPFAQVEARALLRVHGDSEPDVVRVMTTVPFPREHPARQIVIDVLKRNGMQDDNEIERLFGDGRERRIEMTTFLAGPYNSMVFSSLTGPINSDLAQLDSKGDRGGFWTWRRARPLPQFVPVPPSVRSALIRGWFMARAMNQVDVADPRRTPVVIWTPSHGMQAFPFPVLGAPIGKLDETLPALLESLPLALLRMANIGDDMLHPYRRLQELGAGVKGGFLAYEELHQEIRDWVQDGTVAPGAPSPQLAPGPGASREDRLKELYGFFTKFREYFEGFDTVAVDGRSILNLGRTWELRADMVRGLRELEELWLRELNAETDPAIF